MYEAIAEIVIALGKTVFTWIFTRKSKSALEREAENFAKPDESANDTIDRL